METKTLVQGSRSHRRYLLVTFDFPPSVGGIETRLGNYVSEMVKDDRRVSVVHLLNPEDRRRLLGPGLSSVGGFHGASLLRFAYLFHLTPLIFLLSLRRGGFGQSKTVHVFTGANTLLGALFVLFARLAHKDAGVSLFGKDFLASKQSKLYLFPLVLSMLLSTHIMVNSRATLGLISPNLRRKTTVLYPGIDGSALQPFVKAKEVGTSQKVLFVGRLVRRKGLADLVEAFRLVAKENTQAELVIVGDGPFKGELTRIVEDSGLAGRITMKGMLTGADLYSEYASCDVFVMPSRTSRDDMEGFGMVFLEAGFFGKPSIGTNAGGIPEAVIDGETGLLVRQGDIAGLSGKILLVLRDKSLAERLGKSARDRVVANLTWESSARGFLRMYESPLEVSQA